MLRAGTPCDPLSCAPPVNVIRKRQARLCSTRHAVELRHRNIVEVPPRMAVVVRFVQAAVVAFQQMVLIRRVEHQRVIVGVDLKARRLDSSCRHRPVIRTIVSMMYTWS